MTDFEARSRVHALKHHVSEELERIEDELKREELLFSVIPKYHFDRLTTQKNKNLLMKVFSKWLLILLAFDSRRSKKKR